MTSPGSVSSVSSSSNSRRPITARSKVIHSHISSLIVLAFFPQSAEAYMHTTRASAWQPRTHVG